MLIALYVVIGIAFLILVVSSTLWVIKAWWMLATLLFTTIKGIGK